MRKLTSLATATAIVLTSVGLAATPAEARGRYGGWGYRHHDRVSTGDVLGGLLIIGTIAAIASSVSKDRAQPRDRNDRYDPPYRGEPQDVPNYDQQPYETPQPYGSGGSEVRPDGDGDYSSSDGADARAADACSWAVEGEMGDDARVDSITDTTPNNGGWYVTGTASGASGDVRSFGCSYRSGRVVDVNFG